MNKHHELHHGVKERGFSSIDILITSNKIWKYEKLNPHKTLQILSRIIPESSDTSHALHLKPTFVEETVDYEGVTVPSPAQHAHSHLPSSMD